MDPLSLDSNLLDGHTRQFLHLERGRLALGIILARLLHAAQDHGPGRHGLPLPGIRKGLELFVVPLSSRNVPALAIHKHGVVLGAQKVGNRVAVLRRVKGDHAVDARLELHAAGKTQRVADVHKGGAGAGRHEAHFPRPAGPWGSDL